LGEASISHYREKLQEKKQPETRKFVGFACIGRACILGAAVLNRLQYIGMKIAVMGAGALGGYFGARLAASGHEVTFIARGAHLAAMQTGGLRVFSPKGDIHLPVVSATDDPTGVGLVDIILFMVKNYDV
jgi:hypothetical protein